MDKFYELMSYDELDYYYVFSNAKTYELLFLNNQICNFLDLKLEECIGRKCYEVIYNSNEVCPFCVNNELMHSSFSSIEMIKPLNNKEFNCNISIVNMDNISVRVSKLEINKKRKKVINISENDIVNDLLKNIKNENFKLHLQPKFKIHIVDGVVTKKMVGAEVLVRRYDENLKEIITPDNFISFYEQTSIIRHLDLYVFEKTCETLSKINSNRLFNNSFVMNVNLSCATLLEFNFVTNIKCICDKFSIEYNSIMIEITKDLYLENHKNFIKKVLAELSNNGFLIAISYSKNSLQHFEINPNVDFDEVKIKTDMFFYNETKYLDFDNVKIYENVVETYKNSDIFIVGIDSEMQMNSFYQNNCIYQQGFHLHKPILVDDFLKIFVF